MKHFLNDLHFLCIVSFFMLFVISCSDDKVTYLPVQNDSKTKAENSTGGEESTDTQLADADTKTNAQQDELYNSYKCSLSQDEEIKKHQSDFQFQSLKSHVGVGTTAAILPPLPSVKCFVSKIYKYGYYECKDGISTIIYDIQDIMPFPGETGVLVDIKLLKKFKAASSNPNCVLRYERRVVRSEMLPSLSGLSPDEDRLYQINSILSRLSEAQKSGEECCASPHLEMMHPHRKKKRIKK